VSVEVPVVEDAHTEPPATPANGDASVGEVMLHLCLVMLTNSISLSS